MIEIKLRQEDGTEKTVVQDFISARMFRRTVEMQKLFKQQEDGKTTISESSLDTIVDYIVELFGSKFDRDQFYDGVAANQVIPTMTRCIQAVVGHANEAIGADTDPN
ncbi:hypothetical protein VE23_24870 [Paenibacillus sp. D9]|uniref:phage tail assembly chaperone G n=1 Tax=Paenibacillus sp. D9 TaxID=665792 RepID=UPI00061FCAD6|nr:hypothetical protein [Paenibacillus sp. D9]KKC49536.1 hypothetical protein VE23_24870 [Paenibacillus sp. D9]